MEKYRGYRIIKEDTMGNGKMYYAFYKKGMCMGWAPHVDSAKTVIDNIIADEERKKRR